MENNNIQIFNSKRPVYNRYELKINRDESLIQIAIKGEEITEYDIPFSTIAEVEMSTDSRANSRKGENRIFRSYTNIGWL